MLSSYPNLDGARQHSTSVTHGFLMAAAAIILLPSFLLPSFAADAGGADLCKGITRDMGKELQGAAGEVLTRTQPDDTVVLLGQSPAYLFPFLKSRARVFLVAVSGLGADEGERALVALDVDFNAPYCGYLAKAGLKAELLQSGEKVVLVDYSASGQTVTVFAKVLRHCAGAAGGKPEPEHRFRFINLAAEPDDMGLFIKPPDYTYVNHDPKKDIIILPHLGDFASDRVPRVMPYYHPSAWKKPPNIEDDPKLADGKACMHALEALL